MKIFVIIPSYKVTNHISEVIDRIGDEVEKVVIVDDCCPNGSGDFVSQNMDDPRVIVLMHEKNKGVGGAVMTGYKYALENGADICVKIDGDGQMAPELIPALVNPIIDGRADYVKGNRFVTLYDVSAMPSVRIFGNAVLSFITKLSSGYWSIFDPTNGFTAIHKYTLQQLKLDVIEERYFFETSMLIALGGIRAKVLDMPMRAVYEDEVSGLRIEDIIFDFTRKHLKAILKRVVYGYYLRNFSLASIHLPLGIGLFLFGLFFGIDAWMKSISSGIPATSGTVLLSALPTLLGVQFILSFFSYDINNEPSTPLQVFNSPSKTNKE